jgi:hypothetical protein
MEASRASLFSVSAGCNLILLSLPNIIRTLGPAVAASLKNTVPAFRPIKKPRLTYNPSTVRIYPEASLSVCG